MTTKDYSIDFIKGIAILSVIFLHNTPDKVFYQIAWIGQAVPLFLLVTGYLTYGSFQNGKKIKDYYSKSSFSKMLKRIFAPFFIITLLQCVLYYFFYSHFSWHSVISSGGIGPGSYYPWLYLQCWLILPLIIYTIDKLSVKKSISLFICISIALELVSSIISIPPIYRLLFFRYLFHIYLGCFIYKMNVKINIKYTILAIIAMIFSITEIYTDLDFSPYFYNQWKGYHWITAFYAVFIFLLLKKLYDFMTRCIKIQCFIQLLGKNSYEIFLCQMFIFSLFPEKVLSFIDNLYIEALIFIILTLVLSIVPIIIYKKYINNLIGKSKYIQKYNYTVSK